MANWRAPAAARRPPPGGYLPPNRFERMRRHAERMRCHAEEIEMSRRFSCEANGWLSGKPARSNKLAFWGNSMRGANALARLKSTTGQSIDNGDSGMTEMEALNRHLGLRHDTQMVVIIDAGKTASIAKEAGRDQVEALRWSRLRNWMQPGADEIKVAAAVLQYVNIAGLIP